MSGGRAGDTSLALTPGLPVASNWLADYGGGLTCETSETW
jgi:hypothetical protein